jgi:hypothetical protein
MNSTIEQTATEIVALINSKPSTPGVAEIATILGRFATGTSEKAPACDLHTKLHQVMAEADAVDEVLGGLKAGCRVPPCR